MADQSPQLRLYRIDLSLLAGRGNNVFSPMPSYLVRTTTPTMAAVLAAAAAMDRWPDAREFEVLRCWTYPTEGALILHGADHLQTGEPCEPLPREPEAER